MTVFKASINQQWLFSKVSIHYQKEDEPNPDNRAKIVQGTRAYISLQWTRVYISLQWTCAMDIVYISSHKTTFKKVL